MLDTIRFLKSKYMKLFAAVLTASYLISCIGNLLAATETVDYVLTAVSFVIGLMISVGAWTFSLKTSLRGAKILRIFFGIRRVCAWIVVALISIASFFLLQNLSALSDIEYGWIVAVLLFALLLGIAGMVIEANLYGNILNLVRDMTRRIEYDYKGTFISNLEGWSIAGIVVTGVAFVLNVILVIGVLIFAYAELGADEVNIILSELSLGVSGDDALKLFMDVLGVAVLIFSYVVNILLIRNYFKTVVPAPEELAVEENTELE